MPANEDGLQQTTLWTLEDDFEGRSTPGADRSQRANGHDQASIPVALDAAAVREERNEQPPGELGFDGHTYTYTGYVLEEGRYVRRQARFTPDELDIYASEPLWRVCASVDRAGRDAGRQAEIRRFGKRVWHSPYRQQDVSLQGLDYIFRHDVDKVAACYPYAVALYGGDAALADRWTAAMFDAYKSYALHGSRQPLCRLLGEADIPLAILGIGSDVPEEQ